MHLPVFHLSFPVRDLAAAKAFYCGVLGARVGRDNEKWADILLFGHQLTLHQRPDEVLSPELRGVRHFGAILPWSEWEALANAIEAAGARFVSPPTVSFPGTPREQGKLLLCDPSDNLIELKAYRNAHAAFGTEPEFPMMTRILIIGNSGSGKSTRAKALSARHGLAHLDLDAIVWETGQVAVERDPQAIQASLAEFIARHPAWVIEGCYGDLAEAASAHCTQLVFLNPGKEACLANNLRRPWEPHKYATPEAQDAMLATLQAWVAGYYTRDDAWSYLAHRRLFDAHAGPKVEHTTLA